MMMHLNTKHKNCGGLRGQLTLIFTSDWIWPCLQLENPTAVIKDDMQTVGYHQNYLLLLAEIRCVGMYFTYKKKIYIYYMLGDIKPLNILSLWVISYGTRFWFEKSHIPHWKANLLRPCKYFFATGNLSFTTEIV